MFLPIVKCQVKANTVVCRAYLVIRKEVYRQQASQKNSSHSQSPIIWSRWEAKHCWVASSWLMIEPARSVLRRADFWRTAVPKAGGRASKKVSCATRSSPTGVAGGSRSQSVHPQRPSPPPRTILSYICHGCGRPEGYCGHSLGRGIQEIMAQETRWGVVGAGAVRETTTNTVQGWPGVFCSYCKLEANQSTAEALLAKVY